jgi:hypothetical protein
MIVGMVGVHDRPFVRVSPRLYTYSYQFTSKSPYFGGFMRVTRKGQGTIPQEIRDKYGFLPQTEVTFVEEGERV